MPLWRSQTGFLSTWKVEIMATSVSPAGPTSEPGGPKTEEPAPLRAVHTSNFPALLRQLGASLLVTTYQAGKLVMVRDEGDHLNIHFRGFQAPMGMALSGDRLAVGTKIQVWEFVDVPAVARRLPPRDDGGRMKEGGGGAHCSDSSFILHPSSLHDACFLPRSCHVTGNIQIHEMAWGAGNELWVVNTRFSCLCTLDGSASFAPRWRPPFVSALEPTDRCHLNGLGMVDGRPRYVTALGETALPAGWRANKAKGGIVMDVDSGEVITRGLSMPHSPRWYAGRLWVCESGAETFGYIEPNTGRYVPVAEVPGFTRGVDFARNLAFVGLSQVRESAVFSGIAITERLTEEQRTCGVCVIDLTTGQVIGLLRFESAVQEVFAVTVLPGRRYPELINDDEKLLENSFVVPDAALAEVSPALRPASVNGHAPASVNSRGG
jgi:uncharacterized protein (TIGR03032 family)